MRKHWQLTYQHYHLTLRHCSHTHHAFHFHSSTTLSPPPPHLLQPLPRRAKSHQFAHFLQLPIPPSHSHNPILYYQTLHAQLIVSGFHNQVFLANILLHCFSKCSRLRDARLLFDVMSQRNLISWSSLVSMYTRHGFNQKAFIVFTEFLASCDENPNEYILASVFRACSQLGGVYEGAQLHGFVVKTGFEQDVYVGTSLIDFYAKNGDLDEARLVFDVLAVKTAVTWTTIITGYTKSGRGEVSLQLFDQMRETDVVPDKYVLSSVLNACSMLEFLDGGKQIHAYVLRRGTEMDVSVTNVLIDFYAKCGLVYTARNLFDQMVVKNMIAWTTMIAGYMKNSFNLEAMKLFAEMAGLGWKPDGFACTSVLTSCGSLEALEHGRQVHGYTIKANLEYDNFVKNGLIDMYAKCKSLTDARRVFEGMADHNVVSYNAMIEGYSSEEKLHEALDLFREMRLRLLPPSLLTFVSLLGASAALLTLELSKQIHSLIIKYGVSLDVFAGSALIDVYSKCSCIRDARLVFNEINEKDIVVWNAMFFGYTQQLENEEALKLYSELQLSKKTPNEFTFAALITAASNLASLQHGQQLHNQVIKLGVDSDPFVTNSLVDMYAKCGCIKEAHKTFASTFWRDVVCWNSMISTYAQHGEAEDALQMFKGMIDEGVKPNYVTFVGVLSACSHAGLVEDGLRHFESMVHFGIEPGTDHYTCIVSLLGRAGRLTEAREFIDKMPIKPAAVVWRSLLSACRVAGNVDIGRYAAEMAISVDPTDSGSYILLSNIFASKGMWEDVKRLRKRMDFNGVVKEPGSSWIELNKDVHSFVARDRAHSKANLIYSVLDNLILQIKGDEVLHHAAYRSDPELEGISILKMFVFWAFVDYPNGKSNSLCNNNLAESKHGIYSLRGRPKGMYMATCTFKMDFSIHMQFVRKESLYTENSKCQSHKSPTWSFVVSYFSWKALAMGKNISNAKISLEKSTQYTDDMELDDAVHTAILMLGVMPGREDVDDD